MLSRLGPAKASILTRELELPRSELYTLLKRLQEKGMVETTLERPMKFVAISFEKVIDHMIREETMKIEELKAMKMGAIDYIVKSKNYHAYLPHWR